MHKGVIDATHVSGAIAVVMAEKYATLHELRTVYGARDLYTMREVLLVWKYNEAVVENG